MQTQGMHSPNEHPNEHWIRCRHCRLRFDLLQAETCACATAAPTRRCGRCGACLCRVPMARDPDWWVEVPERLRVLGVERIPIDYL